MTRILQQRTTLYLVVPFCLGFSLILMSGCQTPPPPGPPIVATKDSELGVPRQVLDSIADNYLRSLDGDLDADAEFRWAVAKYDPNRFWRLLDDFYVEHRYFRSTKQDPAYYIKKHIYAVAEKKYPETKAEDVPLPSWCLVARRETIENKIAELWQTRDKKKLEVGLNLAAKHRAKLPGNTFVRMIVQDGKPLPVIAREDISSQAFSVPLDDWSICLLEPSQNGGFNIVPVDDPAEFFDERYVRMMWELCQHLGAKKFKFLGEAIEDSESEGKASASARVNAGPVFVNGTASYKKNTSEHALRLESIASEFKNGASWSSSVSGKHEYDLILKRQLSVEEKSKTGMLYAIDKARRNKSNPMTGQCYLFYKYNGEKQEEIVATLKTGCSVFGIFPIGTGLSAEVQKTAKMNRDKTWVFEVEFP